MGPKREVKSELDMFAVRVTPPDWASRAIPIRTVFLTPDQKSRYDAWERGEKKLDEALPDVSPAMREVIETGIAPSDWGAVSEG